MYRFLIAFVAFMYAAMLWPIVRSRVSRMRWLRLWSLFRLRSVPLALLVLCAVVALGLALVSLGPVLSFSWISMVGGSGSLATGGIATSASTDHGPGLVVLSVFVFGAFLILIPQLAHIEERWFRRGAEHRTRGRRLFLAVAFGLSHMVVGVPLGFALALTVLGLACTAVYTRAFARRQSRADAVLASTSFHVTYNATVAFVLVSLIVILSIFPPTPPVAA